MSGTFRLQSDSMTQYRQKRTISPFLNRLSLWRPPNKAMTER